MLECTRSLSRTRRNEPHNIVARREKSSRTIENHNNSRLVANLVSVSTYYLFIYIFFSTPVSSTRERSGFTAESRGREIRGSSAARDTCIPRTRSPWASLSLDNPRTCCKHNERVRELSWKFTALAGRPRVNSGRNVPDVTFITFFYSLAEFSGFIGIYLLDFSDNENKIAIQDCIRSRYIFEKYFRALCVDLVGLKGCESTNIKCIWWFCNLQFDGFWESREIIIFKRLVVNIVQ